MKSSLESVKIKENYIARLRFSDGLEGDVDFSGYVGKGVFNEHSPQQAAGYLTLSPISP